MNKFCVYFHINPITKEVFYVGKGNEYRAYEFDESRRSSFWYNIVNKYGLPIVVIVKNNVSDKYALVLETKYIKLIGRRNIGKGPLVNLTDGGKGSSGFVHSEETKLKISKSVKNTNYILNEEQLKKMSNTHKGNTYCLGNKLTDEHKRKISESHKGNTYCLGNKLTEEHKNNISKGNKGKNLNRIFSDETIQKMSIAAQKRTGKLKWIYNLSLEENKIVNIKDIDLWINKGWIKGRKRKFDKNKKQ